VLTHTDQHGETAMDSTWQQATNVFTTLRDVLDRLVGAPTLS
jgi:hypothetical protein